MSREQWGHGFHAGKNEGEETERFVAWSDLSDICMNVERIKGLLIVLADFECGMRGHDSPTYHGIGAALILANGTIKKISEAKSKNHQR